MSVTVKVNPYGFGLYGGSGTHGKTNTRSFSIAIARPIRFSLERWVYNDGYSAHISFLWLRLNFDRRFWWLTDGCERVSSARAHKNVWGVKLA